MSKLPPLPFKVRSNPLSAKTPESTVTLCPVSSRVMLEARLTAPLLLSMVQSPLSTLLAALMLMVCVLAFPVKWRGTWEGEKLAPRVRSPSKNRAPELPPTSFLSSPSVRVKLPSMVSVSPSNMVKSSNTPAVLFTMTL